MYNTIDDFVMSNLRNYSGKALKSAEDASVKLEDELSEEEKKRLQEAEGNDGADKEKDEAAEKTSKGKALEESEVQPFCDWLKTTLGSRVRAVKVSVWPVEIMVLYIHILRIACVNPLLLEQVTHRLSSSPAIITDHESGAVRRMMKMVVSDIAYIYIVLVPSPDFLCN